MNVFKCVDNYAYYDINCWTYWLNTSMICVFSMISEVMVVDETASNKGTTGGWIHDFCWGKILCRKSVRKVKIHSKLLQMSKIVKTTMFQ